MCRRLRSRSTGLSAPRAAAGRARSGVGDRLRAPAGLAARRVRCSRGCRTTIGALPSPRPLADRLGKGLPAGASLRRLGVLASTAVRSVEAAVPRYSGRPGGGRAPEARLLPGFPSERTLRLRSFANSGGVSRRLGSRRRRAPVWLPHLSLHPAVGTAAPEQTSDVVGGLLRAASTAAPRATAARRDPQAASSRVARESEVELPAAKPDHPRAPDKQAKTDSEADAELLKRKLPAAATDALRLKGNEVERTKAFTSVEEAVLKEKLVSIPVQKQAADPSERALPARPRTRGRSVSRPCPRCPLRWSVQTPDDVLDAVAATSTRECEIHSWRGYVMSEFFAVEVNPDGSRATIATSPAFRWRKRDASRRTPEAAAALQELVTTLEGEGWIVARTARNGSASGCGPRRAQSTPTRRAGIGRARLRGYRTRTLARLRPALRPGTMCGRRFSGRRGARATRARPARLAAGARPARRRRAPGRRA